MTNNEYFNAKPMGEAIAKWRTDCTNGYLGDVQEWLEETFYDYTKGRLIRGRFFTNEKIEEKIRAMEQVNVTGYVLEYQNKNGRWFASEFEPEKGIGSDLWLNNNMRDANDFWYRNDNAVGYFKELPTTYLSDSSDWYDRLRVDFDRRTTPRDRPSLIDTWGGVDARGELWRVRKITIGGELSDKAKDFFRRNPDVVFDYVK